MLQARRCYFTVAQTFNAIWRKEVVTNSINCRELVLDMLLSINRDGEFSHIVIKNVLDKYAYLDKSERSFIKRLCQGTIENQIRIDSIINQISKTPVQKS